MRIMIRPPSRRPEWRVEAYHGEMDNGDIRNLTASVLHQSPDQPGTGDGNYIYQGSVPASESGTYGFSVRVVPTHPCLMQAHELRVNHLVVNLRSIRLVGTAKGRVTEIWASRALRSQSV
jgi:hypothetical protein